LEQEPSTRRSLIQLIALLGVLVAVGGVVLFGGIWAFRSALAARPAESVSVDCPQKSGSTQMTIEMVTRYSGYSFPDGSTVVWAYEETSWFDNSWAMRAKVNMPTGSEVPSVSGSYGGSSSISVDEDGSPAVSVEVHALWTDGKP
jgi:hypothetical protein